MTSKIAKVTWTQGKIKWEPLTDGGAELSKNALQLSRGLQFMSVGLEIAQIGLSAAIMVKVCKIDNKVEKLNAKFDFLFLDKAFDYVVNEIMIGKSITTEIAAILQNDLNNSMVALESNKDLRLPAYLSHKLYRLGSLLSEMNQVLYMMRHGGNLSEFGSEDLRRWIRSRGSEIDLLPPGGFASQIRILDTFEEEFVEKNEKLLDRIKVSKKTPSISQRILEDKGLLSRAHPLIHLQRETQLLAEFTNRAVELGQGDQTIVLKSAA